MKIEYLILFLTMGWSTTQNGFNKVDSKRLAIVQHAEQFLGVKYKAKIDKNIFDCSGYARYIMQHNDVKITRSSISQIHDGNKIKDLKDTKPGDLLIFKGRNVKNNRPGHVGIVHHWSNDTLYFIHASCQKGITIDHLHHPYYKNRLIQARDVIGS